MANLETALCFVEFQSREGILQEGLFWPAEKYKSQKVFCLFGMPKNCPIHYHLPDARVVPEECDGEVLLPYQGWVLHDEFTSVIGLSNGLGFFSRVKDSPEEWFDFHSEFGRYWYSLYMIAWSDLQNNRKFLKSLEEEAKKTNSNIDEETVSYWYSKFEALGDKKSRNNFLLSRMEPKAKDPSGNYRFTYTLPLLHKGKEFDGPFRVEYSQRAFFNIFRVTSHSTQSRLCDRRRKQLRDI